MGVAGWRRGDDGRADVTNGSGGKLRVRSGGEIGEAGVHVVEHELCVWFGLCVRLCPQVMGQEEEEEEQVPHDGWQRRHTTVSSVQELQQLEELLHCATLVDLLISLHTI